MPRVKARGLSGRQIAVAVWAAARNLADGVDEFDIPAWSTRGPSFKQAARIKAEKMKKESDHAQP